MKLLTAFFIIELLGGCMACTFAATPPADESIRAVGVAKIDVTPGYPVRLTGYGGRREVNEGVQQHIFVKALAVGSDEEGPAVMVTVDNCGVPGSLREEVVRRLAAKTKVAGERFAICSSHTHCAPALIGILPNIFSMDIPAEHLPAIERYTRELTDRIEQVALAALADRRPARLAWGVGQVGFARNRRVQTALQPVDHDLPVLRVTSPEGKVRAIFTSYACHATTLQFNFIHGDWPSCAQEALEREFPGAIALTALGCGADQNPHPRGTVELAVKYGEALAAEAKRVMQGEMKTIAGKLECRAKTIALPLDKLPAREEWEKLAQEKRPNIAYHAKKNLERLERGEKLQAEVPYLVQTWTLGKDLAMVFLPGEVVVDYSLRLKRELDRARLWINAYANDVPAYIPSKRVLEEGGYEGASAMMYYDRPTKFAPNVEELVIGAVRDLVPKNFVAKQDAAMPPPKSPAESLALMRTKPGLVVELAAAEPLVVDPVAIDWGADGKLWVVEMRDYPAGVGGDYQPGGLIKTLEDLDGDGRYDQAAVFLDQLPFPTGVTAWGKGALICAAPDILYAEDTNGDGRADDVKKLFTGFATDNYQARVNSLAPGLDNWIHGANGLLGGSIQSFTNAPAVDIRGRDFRMNPESGAFEPAPGTSQQGRCRDDWGNWFGCSNGQLAFHFPLPDHYLRRNPHVPAPASRSAVPAGAQPNQLYPISQALERFNNPGSLNQTTSACGIGIYRDDLLGEDYFGDLFTCEPVHNLVHRLELTPKSVTFEGNRPPDEQASEFLASADNWFRPVQVRTGPDGALWVVDMYRLVIEHPRWIPADKLAKIDVRAGADKGRIYRIYPQGAALRPIRNLTKLATPELVAALDTTNGTTRDRVHLELLRRGDPAAAGPLAELARSSHSAAVRVQAWGALDGLRAATPGLLQHALADAHPAVRRHAIRISERLLDSSPALAAACLRLATDSDPGVRYQLALSLGEWDDVRSAEALAVIAKSAQEDSWIRAAVLSSAARRPMELLKALLSSPGEGQGYGEVIGGLVTTAAGANPEQLGTLLEVIAPAPGAEPSGWQVIGLAHLQEALDRRKITVPSFLGSPDPGVRSAAGEIKRLYDAAPRLARDSKTEAPARLAAIRLLGRGFSDPDRDLPLLARYLGPTANAAFRKTALETLARSRSGKVPEIVLADWAKHAPSVRTAIINILLTREPWVPALLGAIEKGVVGPGDLSTAHRERLAKHGSEKIRQQAEALLPSNRNPRRAEIVAQYRPVAELRGDAVKGAAVYLNLCSQCHAYLGQGHEVGPNIGTFRDKSVQDFLVAILDPNAVVEPRYGAYTLETREGRALYGVISSETATSVVLSQAGGASETILRSDVAALRGSALSLMPEGLEQALAPQDFADLIAYVKGGG